MNKLSVFAAAGALLVLAAQSATASTTKLTVNGMVCAFCAQGIEKKLAALPETKAVYVNLGDKIVAVEAREGQKHDPAKLSAEVKDAGYDVTRIETVGETIEAIKATAKANKK